MLRTGKTVIVWAAVLLTAVDPAAACRWRCCPPPCYYRAFTPCAPVCPPVDCCTESPSAPVDSPAYAPTPAPAPTPAQQAPSRSLRPAPAPLPPPAEPPFAEPPRATTPADPAPELPLEEPAPAPAPLEDMPEAPATPAKPDADVDDLFKETETPKAAPLDAPAPEPPKDSVEDLFKETDDKKSTSTSPALDSEPAADIQPEATSEVSPSLESGASASPNAMRRWIDNTGKYEINARLVMVSQSHVRLLKDTGKYTTVPLSRLSIADLAFVRQHWSGAIAGK